MDIFTFTAFCRRFCPNRLTISTFVSRWDVWSDQEASRGHGGGGGVSWKNLGRLQTRRTAAFYIRLVTEAGSPTKRELQ